MELQAMDLAEVRSMVKWVDEQQRKGRQEVAALQQQFIGQRREISELAKRFQGLEGELATVHARIVRFSQVDAQMDKLKAEIVHLIERVDDRRVRSEKEMERLRQVEHAAHTRLLVEIQEQLPPIPRLAEEMAQRRAEDERLTALIATLQNRIPPIEARIEERVRDVTYLEEAQRQDARRIAELQQGMIQIQKRADVLQAKQLVVEDPIRRNEAKIEKLRQAELGRKKETERFLEQGRLADQMRRQELARGADKLKEFEELMAGYSKQWRLFEEQNRLSKAATAGLHEFKARLERRQNELVEIQRVEDERMKQQWTQFLTEDEKRSKQRQVEIVQWTKEQQREREKFEEQLLVLQDQLDKMTGDVKQLYLLHTKYADSFRQFSRIWLEGYESVIAPSVMRKIPG